MALAAPLSSTDYNRLMDLTRQIEQTEQTVHNQLERVRTQLHQLARTYPGGTPVRMPRGHGPTEGDDYLKAYSSF
jgi:hypothetical protein